MAHKIIKCGPGSDVCLRLWREFCYLNSAVTLPGGMLAIDSPLMTWDVIGIRVALMNHLREEFDRQEAPDN